MRRISPFHAVTRSFTEPVLSITTRFFAALRMTCEGFRMTIIIAGLIIFSISMISLRPQRCCHHAFAAHMPACLLNAKSRLHAVSSSGQKRLDQGLTSAYQANFPFLICMITPPLTGSLDPGRKRISPVTPLYSVIFTRASRTA